MKKGISVIFIFIGAGLSIWSGWAWVQAGMPTHNLFPYKNTFGTNIIHLLYIGLATLIYGVFRYCLHQKTMGKRNA